jgi:hypothetical protein
VLAADRFRGLLAALRLTPAERTASLAAADAVCSHLARGAGAGALVHHTRIVGAWEKGTEIRPPREIDVLVVLRPNREEPRRPGHNGPLETLVDLKQVLAAVAPEAHLRRDGRGVQVSHGGALVNVLAAFARGRDHFDVCDASGDGSYWRFDPGAERAALDDSDRLTRGATRKLVRLLKAWQGYRGVPLPSLAIDLVAVAFLRQWHHAADADQYYDWMVRDALGDLVSRDSASMPVPGYADPFSLGRAWLPLAQMAHQQAAKACEFEFEGRDRDAWWEWEKIFGDVVPLDEPERKAP